MRFHGSLVDILGTATRLQTVRFLLTHEATMTEREMASVLGISHMSVNRTMRGLAELNFVSCITAGKSHLWRTNRRSYAFRVLSALHKALTAVPDPLQDLKTTILKALPRTLIKKVVLFGSVAKGSEGPDSDIDVFILARDGKASIRLEPHIDSLSTRCLDLYGNRLAPYVLTEGEMRHKRNPKLISEISKGLQIYPVEKKP